MRSLSNKCATLTRKIADDQLDVLLMSETWHEGSDDVSLARATPVGYRCLDAARPLPAGASTLIDRAQHRGGLALIYRDNIKAKTKTLQPTTTFEHLCCHMTAGDEHLLLLGVYRPGSFAAPAPFFDELSAVLEQLCTYRCPIVILGDFNVHVDVNDDTNALRLKTLL